MDMFDFYYRQKVLESELDAAFAACETADQALAVDLDSIARTPPPSKDDFGGVMWGFEASTGGGLDIIIAQGAAYDELGRRAATPSSLTITLSNEGDTQVGMGGTGDAAAIALATDEECWVTIFIVYNRSLSDQRYDGYNNLVYFQREESFNFHIKKGDTVSPVGSLTQGHKPAREEYKHLIADVHLKNTGGGIFVYEIDVGATTRRTEFYFDYEATNSPNKAIPWKYNIRDALAAMLEMYNDHVGGLADKHHGLALLAEVAQTWADGEGVAATDVNTVLNEIVEDLAQKRAEGAGSSGTDKIGSEAKAGSAGWTDYTTPLSLPNDTLQAALEAILEAVNSRVFRGGDLGIGGPLAPAAAVEDLGQTGNYWDAYLRDLYINGAVKCDVIPDGDGTRDLGSVTLRWNAFLNSLALYGLMDVSPSGSINCDGDALFNAAVEVSDTGSLTCNGTLTVGLTGSLDCNGVADFAEDAEFHKYLGAAQVGIIPDATYTYGLDIDGQNLNVLCGGSCTQLQKLSGRRSATVGLSVPVASRDVFGFEERGFGGYFGGVFPKNSLTGDDVASFMPPWWAEIFNTGGVVQAAGWTNLAGPGFEVPALNDRVILWYGPHASGVAPFTAAYKPAIHFAIISPSTLGAWAKSKLEIGFQTNAADPTRILFIRFDGYSASNITAGYFDGTTTQSSVLSASAPVDNALYTGRIVYLDDSHFLFSLYASLSLLTELVMTYSGGSPFSLTYRVHPYFDLENGVTGGTGTTIVAHRLQVSTIAFTEGMI